MKIHLSMALCGTLAAMAIHPVNLFAQAQPKLEDEILPQPEHITQAARQLARF